MARTPTRAESLPHARRGSYDGDAGMPLRVSPQPGGHHSRTASFGSDGSATMNTTWKLVTIGDQAVGKTSAIKCATEGVVPPHNLPATVGVDFVQSSVRGIQMQLWDTAGQPNHSAITLTALQGAHYVLYVYAIDSRSSFERIAWWDKTVRASLGNAAVDHLPGALIGNKLDLEEQRQVPREEAQAFAAKHGWLYVETSAKNVQAMQACMRMVGENIERIQKEHGGIPTPAAVLHKKPRQPGSAPMQVARKPPPPSLGQRLLSACCCCLRPSADTSDEQKPLV